MYWAWVLGFSAIIQSWEWTATSTSYMSLLRLPCTAIPIHSLVILACSEVKKIPPKRKPSFSGDLDGGREGT